MKKTAALLLALCCMLISRTHALTGSGYPAWSGTSAPKNSLCAYFSGDMLQLEFDPSAEYSHIENGMITACFFAFDALQQNYLEMYMVLPESVAGGQAFSSADLRGDSSLTLYEVFMDGDDLYFAGQLMGTPYPGGSDYEITIDSAEQENDCLNVQGRLHATLCRIEDNMTTGETLTLKDGSFRFSLPLTDDMQPRQSFVPEASPQPEATQQPFMIPEVSQPPLPQSTPAAKAPAHTMDPHPAFTLPPDYRVT